MEIKMVLGYQIVASDQFRDDQTKDNYCVTSIDRLIQGCRISCRLLLGAQCQIREQNAHAIGEYGQ